MDYRDLVKVKIRNCYNKTDKAYKVRFKVVGKNCAVEVKEYSLKSIESVVEMRLSNGVMEFADGVLETVFTLAQSVYSKEELMDL